MKYSLLLAGWLLTALTVCADKTDRIIKEEMEKHGIPGLSLTVIQNGKRIKTEAYGFSNLELKTPATKDTAFEIGSVTKQFTAAGIMMLVQDGKVSVDEKISKYLKDTPPSWSEITVRHLLSHTSGIKTYTGLDGFALTAHLTQEEFIKKIGALPLDFQPGEKWNYCNTGFNLLGYIIENVSGKNYWTYMGERIFLPLGMTNTVDRDPGLLIPNRADGYEKNRAGKLINRDYDLTDIFSAGAIVSTVGDMAKWSVALDSDKFVNDASKELMWTPTTLKDGTKKPYGFAWYSETLNGHKNIRHSGSTSGFSAAFERFPNDNKLPIIVLCNSVESGVATSIAKKIAPVYFIEGVATK